MPQHDHNKAHQPDAREIAAKAIHDVRGKAEDTYRASAESAKDAATRAARGIEENPLGIIIGGLAVGALVGAVLPRSTKEKQLLAPLGKRLGETARQAFAAAKEAGQRELDQAGLTPAAAKDRGREVIDQVGKALSSAGTAAAQAAKRPEQA